MLTIPALTLKQFNEEFFLLNLAAGDVERLVRFEVLCDAGVKGRRAKKASGAKVNWGELEKRVGTSDKAFQRPIIRKKIDELAQYYTTCREQQMLPAIPGAVILTTESKVGRASSKLTKPNLPTHKLTNVRPLNDHAYGCGHVEVGSVTWGWENFRSAVSNRTWNVRGSPFNRREPQDYR